MNREEYIEKKFNQKKKNSFSFVVTSIFGLQYLYINRIPTFIIHVVSYCFCGIGFIWSAIDIFLRRKELLEEVNEDIMDEIIIKANLRFLHEMSFDKKYENQLVYS